MSKNTQSGGSLLMKLLPNFAKSFLESATQEDVVKAEQQAAAIHEKLQAIPEAKPEAIVEKPVETATVPVAPVHELTAMTTRATTAEAKVTELQGQLTAATADRDKYKAWHDKQSSGGTKLPTADAANRDTSEDNPELSAATADALALFKKRKATA